MAPRLLHDPLAGVDEHEGEIRGRVPRDHVARVLDVPGRVGDDEFPQRCGEVAVGDVDRDALFALGAQPVGEESEVGVLVPTLATEALDRLELVLEDGLGVVEEPADERALAVVDRTGGGEAEELHL